MRKETQKLTFDEFADGLLEEPHPRTLVILASSQIDTQLRSLLEGFFWTKANKQKEPDELLDGESPLSTFSSRIKASRRLGLIDPALADALDKLREVRNQAAHWISFGIADSPLRDQLRNLSLLVNSRRSYRLTVKKYFGSAPLSDMDSLKAVLLTLSVLLASILTKMSDICLPKIQKPLVLN